MFSAPDVGMNSIKGMGACYGDMYPFECFESPTSKGILTRHRVNSRQVEAEPLALRAGFCDGNRKNGNMNHSRVWVSVTTPLKRDDAGLATFYTPMSRIVRQGFGSDICTYNEVAAIGPVKQE